MKIFKSPFSFADFRKALYIAIFAFFGLLILTTTNPLIITPTYQKPENPAQADLLKQHVNYLASLKPQRNFRNKEAQNIAKNYITEQFKKYCTTVQEQEFLAEKTKYTNIICHIEGEQKTTIVVGAHYDVFSEYPGADDNASGIAGLLETARILHETRQKNTIELVAFTNEEPPYFRTNDMGSYHYVRELSEQKADIDFALILECIGYFTDAADSQDYPMLFFKLFYPNAGNFITIAGNNSELLLTRDIKTSMMRASPLPTYSVNAPASLPGMDFSDHLNFWNYGYDAFMITDTAPYRNKNYHTEFDTPENLDYEKMAQVVDGVIGVIKDRQ